MSRIPIDMRKIREVNRLHIPVKAIKIPTQSDRARLLLTRLAAYGRLRIKCMLVCPITLPRFERRLAEGGFRAIREFKDLWMLKAVLGTPVKIKIK